ncbi:hypothetical protein [Clostridium autoethanogenum]|uniref:hypothetical protein n=1 Tax=Clostridium autoethanogenum TaxID=84023 RepID=UPI0016054F3C|nr:hypothetical protein [Clostridium autoethanogenum]
MYDTYYKHFIVELLPEIVKYLKDQGFNFRIFENKNLTETDEKELIKLGMINKK